MVFLFFIDGNRRVVITIEYWCHFLGNNADICQYNSHFVSSIGFEVDNRQYVKKELWEITVWTFQLIIGSPDHARSVASS